MRALALAAVVACSHPAAIQSTAVTPLPVHPATSLDTAPRGQRRMVPAEAFLRAYLMWFGGLAPMDVQKKGGSLFEQWSDYLGSLGLPDYAHDFPRVSQSNTMMLATLDRLAEILCVRAAEHDLHAAPPLESRVVFAFDAPPRPAFADFIARFDILHRTFLGYPVALAPEGRSGRFYALYQQVASNHPASQVLTADETAWVAVCKALAIHPEAELY